MLQASILSWKKNVTQWSGTKWYKNRAKAEKNIITGIIIIPYGHSGQYKMWGWDN